jgi:hypothetical protein
MAAANLDALEQELSAQHQIGGADGVRQGSTPTPG